MSTHEIFVVSDGTGKTATQTLSAALTQFTEADVNLHVRSHVRDEPDIASVMEEAARSRGFVVHTLVTQELRDAMTRQGRLHHVETIDLLGSLLARLADRLADSPSEEPGLFRHLDESYFRTLATMEFAIKHDDGLRTRELDKAEIVLVGVSRTFKTPLSIYLAFKGWYVANVPIILNTPTPPDLLELPRGHVFGLTINAVRLVTLRKSRHIHLGGSTGSYVEADHVRDELRYARCLFARAGWPIIDVTDKPIEEIASQIAALRRSLVGS